MLVLVGQTWHKLKLHVTIQRAVVTLFFVAAAIVTSALPVLQRREMIDPRTVLPKQPIVLAPERPAKLREYSFSQLLMAMPMRITVWCESSEQAQSACKKAFRRASELVKIFSDYDPNSEASRLAESPIGQATPVSHPLIQVLEFSRLLCLRSDGAFDPTASPSIKLWRRARRDRSLPTPKQLREALDRSGFQNLKIDPKNKFVTLLATKAGFDFGGIAKGYIGDQVINSLRESGIRVARYKAGGDIVLGDSPPATDGWEIGVGQNDDGTEKIIQVSNCGISTSGDSQQFVDIKGKRYSHVIDPRTGIGLATGKTAFAIAPLGMQSDALATAGTILADNDFQRLLEQYDDSTGWTE